MFCAKNKLLSVVVFFLPSYFFAILFQYIIIILLLLLLLIQAKRGPRKVCKFVARRTSRVHRTATQKLELRIFLRTLEGPPLTLSSSVVGCVAQWSRINFHLLQIRRERVRISGEAILLQFVHFFCLFSFMIIFPVILTADPSKLRENFAITYF